MKLPSRKDIFRALTQGRLPSWDICGDKKMWGGYMEWAQDNQDEAYWMEMMRTTTCDINTSQRRHYPLWFPSATALRLLCTLSGQSRCTYRGAIRWQTASCNCTLMVRGRWHRFSFSWREEWCIWPSTYLSTTFCNLALRPFSPWG